jgi:hypothetical protein
MAYIGNEVTQSEFTSVEYTATADQTTFPASGVLPQTALNQAAAIVKVNGLVSHTDSYTIGTTLVFDSPGLDAGDKIEIVWLGLAGSLTTVADNTVTNAKLARAGTSGQVLTSSGTGADVDWGDAIGHASTWIVNDSFTGDANPIGESDGSGGYIGTPNEVADGYLAYSRIGDAMTQTLGVFTFPSTGVYMIGFGSTHDTSATVTSSDATNIMVSTNGGTSFTNASGQYFASHVASGTRISTFQQMMLDVDNVSNIKVQFTVDADASITTFGFGTAGNGRRDTYFTFVKLASTR